jgi:hypothetical protein
MFLIVPLFPEHDGCSTARPYLSVEMPLGAVRALSTPGKRWDYGRTPKLETEHAL